MKISRNSYLVLAAFALLLLALLLVFRPKNPEFQPSVGHSVDHERRAAPAPSPSSSSPVGEAMPAENGAAKQTTARGETPESASGPAKTRASHRDEVVTSSGKRKTLIDSAATATDQPPWPEGPRLFAEVESSTRRYVNLRPDDYGEMPRVRAEPNERLEVRMTFPEGETGEKIHVELPNGGAFADSDVRGRIYMLPENHTLILPFLADDAQGYCNLKIHHRGHSRSLPVWVGELPETAKLDPES